MAKYPYKKVDMFRNIRLKLLVSFLQRNDSAVMSGRYPVEAWHQYLRSQTGASGSISDLEKIWLRTEGGVGETLHDLWTTMLHSKGYSGGLDDMMRQFLAQAVDVASLSLLQQSGASLLMENANKLILES